AAMTSEQREARIQEINAMLTMSVPMMYARSFLRSCLATHQSRRGFLMLTTNERRMLLFMTDDERHTVDRRDRQGSADGRGRRPERTAKPGSTRPRGFALAPGRK